MNEATRRWNRTFLLGNRIVLMVLSPLAVLFVLVSLWLHRTLTLSSAAIFAVGTAGILQELASRDAVVRRVLTILTSAGLSALILQGLVSEQTSAVFVGFGVAFVTLAFLAPLVLEARALSKLR